MSYLALAMIELGHKRLVMRSPKILSHSLTYLILHRGKSIRQAAKLADSEVVVPCHMGPILLSQLREQVWQMCGIIRNLTHSGLIVVIVVFCSIIELFHRIKDMIEFVIDF